MRPAYRLALLLAIGCRTHQDGPAEVAMVRDSSGVAIVDNRGTDRPLSRRFARVAIIAATDSGADFTQLTDNTVTSDTLGHVFVLDSWFGQRVQVLDTTGRVIRHLTRSGQGPGEIGRAVSIAASGDGVLSILDFAKTAMVRVRWDGTVLPQLSMAGFDLFGGGRSTGDTVVVHTVDLRTPTTVERLQYRTATDTATLVRQAPQRLPTLHFCQSAIDGLTPMLAPELRWTSRGATTAESHTTEYRIDRFLRSRLEVSVRRSVAAVTGNQAAVNRFFPDGKIIGTRDCVVRPDELVAKRGVASAVQPIRRLAIDPDGRLWAERNTFPDEPGRTDVFDATGRYLGTLNGFGAPLGFPARGLFIFALPDSTTDIPHLGIFRRSPRGE